MAGTVLVLNVGSSSVKFAAYAVDEEAGPLLAGIIDGIGTAPAIAAKGAAGDLGPLGPGDGHAAIIERLVAWLEQSLEGRPMLAAGHRVVHGGRDFAAPVLIDDAVLARLDGLVPLAPQHQPNNLAGIRTLAAALPGLPQVACFDTAFHRTQPRIAQLFAIPHTLADRGILRYGFHGLSYEHVATVLPEHAGERAEGRVVVAHLGHGASLCAMRGRQSVATTMGFTALDGLVMGRRPGLLDPGVVLHLLQEQGMGAAEVSELLYQRSGLLGVSGLSGDMRDLLGSDAPRAREAVELFVYRAVLEIGAFAAALGGLDILVFTAGIGENAAEVRARIADGLGWLGLGLDPAANTTGGPRISAAGSAVEAYVIPADEEGVIARHTMELCRTHGVTTP
jgi:acetate kinase